MILLVDVAPFVVYEWLFKVDNMMELPISPDLFGQYVLQFYGALIYNLMFKYSKVFCFY